MITDRERIKYMSEQIVNLRSEKFDIALNGFVGGFCTALFIMWFVYTCILH